MRSILTYHSIDSSSSAISIDEACFRRHVRWLASGNIEVTTLQELLQGTADRHAVALTFDDAFENFGTVAWPLLRELELPATLFVPTGHVGATNEWSGKAEPGIPTLPLLDWNALCRLAEDGLTLGPHGHTHRDLRRVDESQLSQELEGAAEVIRDRTGQRPTVFAYPYGRYDDRVVARVRSVYEMACTTDLRPIGGEEAPHRLPRLDAYYFQRPGALERWGSRRFRWSLWLRRVVRGARQAVADSRTPRR